MAHRGRRNADDALALALAAGKTLRDAANEAMLVRSRPIGYDFVRAPAQAFVLRYRSGECP